MAALLGMLAGLTACSSPAAVSSTTTTSPAAEETQPPNSGEVAAIEVTEDGFTPDRLEVTQGTRVTLTNATASKQSVVVKGRDFEGGDDGRLDIEAGQTLDLNLYQVGAYILTLGDDPQTTASIFIS
jgi:plastocyanin